jgi:hypothetical protein
MAADRLTVDLGGLESFAADLESIRATMSGAHGWMNEFEGELGGREVDDAVEHFESNWSDGRSRVDKNCERFVKMTQQTVENLRKADDELTAQLRDGGKGD